MDTWFHWCDDKTRQSMALQKCFALEGGMLKKTCLLTWHFLTVWYSPNKHDLLPWQSRKHDITSAMRWIRSQTLVMIWPVGGSKYVCSQSGRKEPILTYVGRSGWLLPSVDFVLEKFRLQVINTIIQSHRVNQLSVVSSPASHQWSQPEVC